jgi:hypothetical protein
MLDRCRFTVGFNIAIVWMKPKSNIIMNMYMLVLRYVYITRIWVRYL